MLASSVRFLIAILCIVSIAVLTGGPAMAGTPGHWYLEVAGTGSHAIIGTSISIDPRAKDGYDGDPADGDLSIHPDLASKGVWLLYYRVQGPDWTGATGFYGEESELTPVPPGGSKTWYEFYLWSQNYTPTTADLVVVAPDSLSLAPPAGYRAHLVLDYVPDSCNWSGPTDVWINDLTTTTTFALPIPVVTDPLQGTQFHIDVYAPVPEPSSLAALACGLVAVGGVVLRRRP